MENMIIFGAGKAGFRAKRDVEGRFCVKYFADNDKKKQGQILDGIPIISVEKAIELVEKQECKGSLLISTYINREGGRRFGVYRTDSRIKNYRGCIRIVKCVY